MDREVPGNFLSLSLLSSAASAGVCAMVPPCWLCDHRRGSQFLPFSGSCPVYHQIKADWAELCLSVVLQCSHLLKPHDMSAGMLAKVAGKPDV